MTTPTADHNAAQSPQDPGYGRDESLEAARGTGRPAAADLEPHKLDADPSPDRHIHFSPEADGAGEPPLR